MPYMLKVIESWTHSRKMDGLEKDWNNFSCTWTKMVMQYFSELDNNVANIEILRDRLCQALAL